jgi:hypothetical protein
MDVVSRTLEHDVPGCDEKGETEIMPKSECCERPVRKRCQGQSVFLRFGFIFSITESSLRFS